jgi:hypothetical protein
LQACCSFCGTPRPNSNDFFKKIVNWREWRLRLFIAEINGQIDAGCFHWAILPEGHKLLNPVVVFTQKLQLILLTNEAKRECVLATRVASQVNTRT